MGSSTVKIKAGPQEGVACGVVSRRQTEETLFSMLSDLEVWRLPPSELMTPWVPGQILVSHVAAHCRSLQDRQQNLVIETRDNLDEIARLNSTIKDVTARLETVDIRSK